LFFKNFELYSLVSGVTQSSATSATRTLSRRTTFLLLYQFSALSLLLLCHIYPWFPLFLANLVLIPSLFQVFLSRPYEHLYPLYPLLPRYPRAFIIASCFNISLPTLRQVPRALA
ncbi:hypothetical protein R3P38DRAFT_3408297, partial [Favolaschia claudopus]